MSRKDLLYLQIFPKNNLNVKSTKSTLKSCSHIKNRNMTNFYANFLKYPQHIGIITKAGNLFVMELVVTSNSPSSNTRHNPKFSYRRGTSESVCKAREIVRKSSVVVVRKDMSRKGRGWTLSRKEKRGRHRVIRYQISARPCSQAKRVASRTVRVKFREEA